MKSEATNPEEYIRQLPPGRKEAMIALRSSILRSLPEGFREVMAYGMLGYVVPHELYPEGYHADPKQPLPFICIASQKNFIALYHMGIYTLPEINKWFVEAYLKQVKKMPDMGKSCIRFKKEADIPFNIIEELSGKITVAEWIHIYDTTTRSSQKRKKDSKDKSQ